MSEEEEEKSIEHIDRLFDAAVHCMRDADTVNTYKLDELLPGLQGNVLTLDDVGCLSEKIAAIIQRDKSTDALMFRKAHRGVCTFVDKIRQYFASDVIRKEVSSGKVPLNATKKRKYDEYVRCTDLRAHACTKYRELVEKYTDYLGRFQIQRNMKVYWMRQIGSNLRCEDCGRGAGKHQRPGLMADHAAKEMKKLKK